IRPWLRARAVALCTGKTERLGAFPFGGAYLIVGVPVPGFVAAAALVRRLSFFFVPLPLRGGFDGFLPVPAHALAVVGRLAVRFGRSSRLFVVLAAVLGLAPLLPRRPLGPRRQGRPIMRGFAGGLAYGGAALRPRRGGFDGLMHVAAHVRAAVVARRGLRPLADGAPLAGHLAV